MSEAQLDSQLIYAVDRDNADAWGAMLAILQANPKPGSVIPLTAKQFEALKSGVLVLQLPMAEQRRSATNRPASTET